MVEKQDYRKVYKILQNTAQSLIQLSDITSEKSHPLSPGTINNLNNFEIFSFLINYDKTTIEEVSGVQQCLGLSSAEFRYEQFLKIIHPSHFIAVFFFEMELMKNLLTATWPIKVYEPKFISVLALRDYRGNFFLCKRIFSPYKITKGGHMLSSINQFTIIKEFKNEPFNMRVTTHKKEIWKDQLYFNVRQLFKSTKIFSPSEYKILETLSKQNLSIPELALYYQLSVNTIKTFYKRIFEKANILFDFKFENMSHLVDFLKMQHLI